ncbi:targeting protein for Xklp2-like isoform X2 [Cuculus canorus]|uniref:targeting protein for Xklp2-like isoform X2 n=1 Tax=Cuculus canorus TaxID=55661 RepID=UPI0023AB4AD3|nr:targeting protein for Xklp2-like isoform X2 [Cuculus canorus]
MRRKVLESLVPATNRELRAFEKRWAGRGAVRKRRRERVRQDKSSGNRKKFLCRDEKMVHEANPVRKHRSAGVEPSDQPLTVPKSADVSSRLRC